METTHIATLPSELYRHNILINLPIGEIYRIGLTGKTNYKHCEDVYFWEEYFHNKSHNNIQNIVKDAAKNKLFGFVEFICENYQSIKIFLDIRTLVYCYYYFTEQNNIYATNYLYAFLRERYPYRVDFDSNREYPLPKDIYVKLEKIRWLYENIESASDQEIQQVYSDANLYYEYIAQYIVDKYPLSDWSSLFLTSIKVYNDSEISDYWGFVGEILAYLIRSGDKKSVDDILSKISDERVYGYLYLIFIENCDFDWYMEKIDEINNNIRNDNFPEEPTKFQDQKIFEFYWLSCKDTSYLELPYLIFSPEDTMSYLSTANRGLPIADTISYYARADGYTHWANNFDTLLSGNKTKHGLLNRNIKL